MIDSTRQQHIRPGRSGHAVAARAVWAAGMAFALCAALAGIALANGAATVGSTSSSTLDERIAVSSAGRTLYALSPETAGHLLCRSSACLRLWPPLTVPSRASRLTAGPGLHGRLGILRRSNGMLQVTLRGLPLYRFSGDHGSGQTHGQGIESFGGTWHAVGASATQSPTPATPTPAPAPTPTPTPTPAPSEPPGYAY
jgi:predicted lipoprotein with Yx(FWY)xxD motif